MLNDEMLERYSRHILIKDVGMRGQKKIIDGKVLIIGAGGLGSPAAMYLAAAGVGTIGIADGDVVDLSNLQRQIIHTTEDIGKDKVKSAEQTISALNPNVKVEIYKTLVNSKNIVDIIKDRDYDFVIDATDNFSAKLLINDACVLLKKPFSHAGIIQFQGQTITYVPGSPCYRCAFPDPLPESAAPSCRQAGVFGVMAGIMGTVQATEALKYLLGIGDLLTGQILIIDALSMEFKKLPVQKAQKCAVCSDGAKIKLSDYEQNICGS
jgi:molybdopterin/thiamine biosynthesis adenylyltransferase